MASLALLNNSMASQDVLPGLLIDGEVLTFCNSNGLQVIWKGFGALQLYLQMALNRARCGWPKAVVGLLLQP